VLGFFGYLGRIGGTNTVGLLERDVGGMNESFRL